MSGDERGTSLEVYPRGTEIHEVPGDNDATGLRVAPRRYNATHFAMATKLGEDEVLACVVLRDGMTVDALDLIKWCEPRLAYFAIPRYVDFLDELPLTANGKVEKYRLRERGVTPTTWDREQAGYVLRR